MTPYSYPSEPPPPFGPTYPALPAVAKFRRQRNPDPKTYGQAVRAAIRALQRSELQTYALRNRGPRTVNCASGTKHTSGKKIRAAIREQHRAALRAAANGPTFARTDEELREAYLEAIAAKTGLPEGRRAA